ncbi:MAG: dephospho-CoA kinase [Candidatus Acidiferrales bacterium]|jgi:dephospho-CoA kinase
MLRVGLTGGIASGKSTVGGMLRELDCPVLDADTLGHELLEQGQPAREEVIREFGQEVLDARGNVDRGKLGQIIFADAAKRARLNQILHPRILDVVRKWFAAQGHPGGPELAVVEAALIIEAGYNNELDRVIVCWCPVEQQLQRLVERGLTAEQAKLRIAAQMPMEEKRRLADEAIDCSGSIEETERQVMEVVKRLSQPATPAGGNIS